MALGFEFGRTPDLNDATFTFPGGEVITCSKFLLAARSPVFMAMLYGHMSEANAENPNIHIVDSSPVAFRHFLSFICTDSFAVTTDVLLAHEVRLISRKYCCTRLQNISETVINQMLSPGNAGTHCSEAFRNQDFELVTKCLQIIAGYIANTPSSEIAKLPLECMKLLVQADETNASEVTIFRACVAWAQSRSGDTNTEIQCLLPLIRFQNMTPEQLAKEVVPSGLMSPEQMLDTLAAAACGKLARNPRHISDSVFLLGGSDDIDSFLNSAFRLEQHGDSFEWKPLIPVNQQRLSASACVCRGTLYCVGGDDENADALSSVEALDLSACSSWAAAPHMSIGRERHTVCCLQDRVYAIGGLDPDDTDLASVEAFDPDTNQWTAVSPMNTARYDCSSAVLGDKMYVTGGNNGIDDPSSSVECYDPASDTWSIIASMLSERAGHASCASNGKLFVFGGEVSSVSAECYDPATGQWSELAPMPEKCGDFGCAVLGDSILVCGRYVNGEHSDTCHVYYPITNTWRSTPLKLPYPMAYFAMCGSCNS